LQGALHGLSRAERRKRGDELLERVGLSEAADRQAVVEAVRLKEARDLLKAAERVAEAAVPLA
jgi:ABC-2 type transport system ATP-binding protein